MTDKPTPAPEIPPAVNPGIQLPGPFAPPDRSFVFGWRHLVGPWGGYRTGWDFDHTDTNHTENGQ